MAPILLGILTTCSGNPPANLRQEHWTNRISAYETYLIERATNESYTMRSMHDNSLIICEPCENDYAPLDTLIFEDELLLRDGIPVSRTSTTIWKKFRQKRKSI